MPPRRNAAPRSGARRRRRAISRRYVEPRWAPFLSQTSRGVMTIEGVDVRELAEKYGTPLYVMVESEIRRRLRHMKSAFPYSKIQIQFATKCNSNLEILRIVHDEGVDLDASTVGEVIMGLLADFEPHQITFTNLYKSEQDISFAAVVGVNGITADSLEDVQRMIRAGETIKKKIPALIRINPMINLGEPGKKKAFGVPNNTMRHQYGIPLPYAKRAFDMIAKSKYVELKGLHFHGSYISDPKVWAMAADRLCKLARYCLDTGHRLKIIDLGGGFPVEQDIRDKKGVPFTPAEIGPYVVKNFEKSLKKYGLPKLKLIFEPGKFIVANAGIGLMKVISRKRLGRVRRVLVTDGSTYAFIPDVLVYNVQYEILPATRMNRRRTQLVDVAGCTCDSIDMIGRDRSMPKLGAGDMLAVMDVGAYSSVMASNFNGLKRPAMVMVKEDGSVKLIRRRDRYAEMFAPELDVLKVADPNELKNYYNTLRKVNLNSLWTENGKKKKKGKAQRKKRKPIKIDLTEFQPLQQ